MANGRSSIRGARRKQEHPQPSADAAPAVELTPDELLRALESLYSDDVQPNGRVLVQRLRERAAAHLAEAQGVEASSIDQESMASVDPKLVRKICETMPEVTVLTDHGFEFSVLLANRSHTFLNPLSREDCYSEELWEDLAAYFQSLASATLPGGRYACARWLVAQKLQFLEKYTLGEVCHIVQLCIGTRKLLGYSRPHLVPYNQSDEFMKDECAQQRQQHAALKTNTSRRLPIASLNEVRHCLRQLLEFESISEPGIIVVSNLKRLFRSRFKLELSETALGFPRLHNLLRDERFQDFCSLSTSNGQHVVYLAEANTKSMGPVVSAIRSHDSSSISSRSNSPVASCGTPSLRP